MLVDIAEDFEFIDGLESVTVVQAGTGKRQIVDSAFPSPVTARDAIGSDGTYRQGDMKFTLPAAKLPLFVPVAGDSIEAGGGVVWQIGAVETICFATQYRAWGKRADLNPATSAELKIFRPKHGKDESGAAVRKWLLWGVLAGHVNEAASVVEVESGRKRLKITHQIFITDPKSNDIQAGWQIKDKTGATWNCLRVTSKGNMGQATILDVEKSRTPVTD